MSSNNYVPRVTQLDALQLDDEVVSIFKNQLLETSKHFSPGVLSSFLPELELLLKSFIFKYSLCQNDCTFGQQMLSLKYDKALLARGKLYWYYGYMIVIKYLKDRVFMSFTSNETAQSLLSSIEKFQVIGDFLNYLRFLQVGKHPALIDYLLNLEVASDKSISNRFTDYAWTRELLWHSFIELLGFAAPMLNASYVRRIIKERLFNIFRRKQSPVYSSFTNTVPTIKETTKCPECGCHPILPHYMGCDHIFCHYCLQANKMENSNYKCPRCSYSGIKVMRLPCG